MQDTDFKEKLRCATGKVVRETRLGMHYSQEFLAGEARIDRTFLSRLEGGKKMPTLTTIFKLAQILGVSPSAMIRQIEKTMQSTDETQSFLS